MSFLTLLLQTPLSANQQKKWVPWYKKVYSHFNFTQPFLFPRFIFIAKFSHIYQLCVWGLSMPHEYCEFVLDHKFYPTVELLHNYNNAILGCECQTTTNILIILHTYLFLCTQKTSDCQTRRDTTKWKIIWLILIFRGVDYWSNQMHSSCITPYINWW